MSSFHLENLSRPFDWERFLRHSFVTYSMASRVDKYVKINEMGGFNHKLSDDCRVVFDLTHFGSARNYKRFLKKFNLKSGYKRYSHTVESSVSEDRRYYNFVWANSRVGIKTRNNPLTGQHTRPSQRQKEKGYASSIVIEGQCRDVKQMRDWIVENARNVKGRKHRRIRKAFNNQHEPTDRDGSNM